MQNELIREIEQFLYKEARLLDSKQFREWLDLFSEDVHYWMPVNSSRYPKHSRALRVQDESRLKYNELGELGELAYFDEDKKSLEARINRFDTGMAWAEDPPSRTRHIISNVELAEGATNTSLKAYSNFVVYRNRGEKQETYFVGGREDEMKKVNGEWKITRRKIILDQNILLSKNLSIFF